MLWGFESLPAHLGSTAQEIRRKKNGVNVQGVHGMYEHANVVR
jgi:hypothetical protein